MTEESAGVGLQPGPWSYELGEAAADDSVVLLILDEHTAGQTGQTAMIPVCCCL